MSDAAVIAVNETATRALRASPLEPFADVAPPAVQSPVPRNLADCLKIANFELGDQIGAGGMGTVYKAVHTWLGRTVAVKFISRAALCDPEAIQRFACECRAIGKLDHPNIVRAMDAGCVGGNHFLVTEFVDGCDLARLVQNAGPLRTADACEMIRQAALGLQHAHEQELVHRDVKPSNLLLSSAGIVKMLDFGLARLASNQTTLTTTGQMIGTLDFLAPEQASDARRVDIRADIYSLGCTFYFLLTGRAPFSGPMYGTPASKIKGHLADQPPPPTVSRARIPPAIITCLERMMAKAPEERFQTPADVAAALSSHVGAANLSALASKSVCSGLARPGRNAGEPFAMSLLRFAAAVTMMIGRGFRRLFTRRKTFADRPRREPIISIGGLVGLIVLALILSHFSCIPMGMPGRLNNRSGAAPDPDVHYFRFGAEPAEHH